MDGAIAYEQLGELYDIWCAEVAEDIPFYTGLAGSLAGELGRETLNIVELGAGSGRITLPLARAGHCLTAIDASPTQLSRLQAQLAPGATVTTHVADMRHLANLVPAASVDLIIAPFRALLHVTADREELFSSVHDALRPGGVVAFDVFHPSAEQVAATHGKWLRRRTERTDAGRWRFDERATYDVESATEPGGIALDVDVRCSWAPRRGRQGMRDPRDAKTPPTETVLQLQLIPAERWRRSLERAGFLLDGAYGWFDGRKLDELADDDSIWVARRA